MLDSPVSPGWDLSVEMASYVRKLQHVSANCRLSVDEELTLLSRCVCDPSDRRFDEVCAPHRSSRVISRSRPKETLLGLNARQSARQRGTVTQSSERTEGGPMHASAHLALVLTTAPAPLRRHSIRSIRCCSARTGARSSVRGRRAPSRARSSYRHAQRRTVGSTPGARR